MQFSSDISSSSANRRRDDYRTLLGMYRGSKTGKSVYALSGMKPEGNIHFIHQPTTTLKVFYNMKLIRSLL